MRVLAVSAHPDDETMFAGGLLARLAREGHSVWILCSTRGEGGEVGDPPVGPQERLGEIRETEMRCAAAALGAQDVSFLDYVDPRMEIDGEAQAIDATLDQFVAAILPHLERIRPELLITHGTNGEYGHPQHIFTHQAAFEAVRRLGGDGPRELLTWCASQPGREDRLLNQDDPADEVLDITPWLDAKLAAADCHRSQHTMFRRNNEGKSLADAIRRTESYRRWTLPLA